jgi:hypothetical protein
MANAVRRTIYLPESLDREYVELGREKERSFSYFARRALSEYKGDNRVIRRVAPVNTNRKEQLNG